MNNLQSTKIKNFRQKLNDCSITKMNAAKNIVIGSSSFLLLTPIYITNISEETIPIAILSLLEIGSLYLPIKGIINIKKAKNEIKLIRKEITSEKSNNDIDDIYTAYQLIRKDINKKLGTESKSKNKENLKRLRSNIDKIYQGNIKE